MSCSVVPKPSQLLAAMPRGARRRAAASSCRIRDIRDRHGFCKVHRLGVFGDDGGGRGFAGLVLRPVPVLLRGGVLRLDPGVLVVGQSCCPTAVCGGCRSMGR